MKLVVIQLICALDCVHFGAPFKLGLLYQGQFTLRISFIQIFLYLYIESVVERLQLFLLFIIFHLSLILTIWQICSRSLSIWMMLHFFETFLTLEELAHSAGDFVFKKLGRCILLDVVKNNTVIKGRIKRLRT